MTQEIAVRTASKFLQQVYRDADIECHATILNAEANYLEGNKEGIKIITDALNGVKGFCDDLIVGMGGVPELWKDADDETSNDSFVNPDEFDLRLNRLLKEFEALPKNDMVDCLSFYLNVALSK